ncbi:hypothetical protein H5183_00995 [Pseudoalteromonas sp. SR44-8]|uniref:hypothetical protein n=1 Tax=Pseudoalteromonas sp. SR44-8 TaxID=2760933 RepID=UPI001602B710|nr:hypothetical protein [Pseudoalteromonas sp. SR44-8]MBB1299899.1 hypothetical protein [Pseudoalteromonas sp. SR44-8]
MENSSEQKVSTQHSNYEFKPDFGAALEREVNNEHPSPSESVDTDIADSFGSWREWD